MQAGNEVGWRRASDLVMTPDLRGIEWNGFESGLELVNAGEVAASTVAPAIQSWFSDTHTTATLTSWTGGAESDRSAAIAEPPRPALRTEHQRAADQSR
jgi:hypothetical protein